MTQHGKYGDAPLGKSDEELREEGAEAQTNTERQRHVPAGSEAQEPVAVPVLTNTQPGTLAPGLIVTEADLNTDERDDH